MSITKAAIKKALELHEGNIVYAANALGYQTVYGLRKRLKKYPDLMDLQKELEEQEVQNMISIATMGIKQKMIDGHFPSMKYTLDRMYYGIQTGDKEDDLAKYNINLNYEVVQSKKNKRDD